MEKTYHLSRRRRWVRERKLVKDTRKEEAEKVKINFKKDNYRFFEHFSEANCFREMLVLANQASFIKVSCVTWSW